MRGEGFEMDVWDGVLGFSREVEPTECIYREKEIYYKEVPVQTLN